jgi:protein phosphatase methylesterase 1
MAGRVCLGAALAAAPAMRARLASRPYRFVDLNDARAWARAAPGPAFASQLIPATDGRSGVVWRTPLQATAPFWDGWFRGLSAVFLAHKLPKLLMLADTDRLDNELTIAQMQGRFQLVLMPGAGHALHEDAPEATAATLASFIRRCILKANAAAAAHWC